MDDEIGKKRYGVTVWIAIALFASVLVGAAPGVQAQDEEQVTVTTSLIDGDRKCSGSVDYNCEYCSYEGGNNDRRHSYCNDDSRERYQWRQCGIYVNDYCQVGFTVGDIVDEVTKVVRQDYVKYYVY